MSPYRSKRQWKWGAVHFSEEKHREWAHKSPPYAKLPNDVSDKKPKKRKKK